MMMRSFLILITVVIILPGFCQAAGSPGGPRLLDSDQSARSTSDLPARPPEGAPRADTLDFGYYTMIAGQAYAVAGEIWTWDHGASDAFEGWYSVDFTENTEDFFRQITASSWSGHGNLVAAPVISGAASIWCGIFEDQADALCWEGGLGYGNNWCQRFESPEFQWTGAGAVNLQFQYFNNSEEHFDYSRLILVGNGQHPLNEDGFTGVIGTPPAGPWATYVRAITQADFQTTEPTPFRLRFEFRADGGWSDEDGDYPTSYGPLGFDEVSVTGAVEQSAIFGFESGLEGWTASRCPGIGSYFAVHPLSQYVIQDPCQCKLAGNIVGFHDASGHHVNTQYEAAVTPIVDRSGAPPSNRILAEWDQYSELPQTACTFYRPQWQFYPYLCPSTGQATWSPITGQAVWQYTGDTPVCTSYSNVATDWGIPSDCQLVRFAYEVYSSTDQFMPMCLEETNVTPLLDNVRIRTTQAVAAPQVHFEVGCQFQDGFGQGSNNGCFGYGNANVFYPTTVGGTPDGRWRLGDSLVVSGPVSTPSTKWESKLWFRIKREGPCQIHVASYRAWKDKVRDGRQIVGPTGAFTWAWMDSVELGQVSRNKFDSYFRENDDDYTPGPGPRPDIGNQNAIIPDGILTPGGKIEYFITSNYTCTPTEYFVMPDTTGGNYYEFEILPSYRNIIQPPVPPGYGGYAYPSVLYVNAAGQGTKRFVEGSLNMVVNGHPLEGAMNDIPDPTKWDRYDYLGAASSYHAPMIRGTGNSNNGATVAQLMGYRLVLFNTGDYPSGTTSTADWQGLDQWLTMTECGGNTFGQGLWVSGDQIADVIEYRDPGFLAGRLGAVLNCTSYNLPTCPAGDPDNDENYCVGLETTGPAWTPDVELDLWGNWCPQQRSFSVLGTAGGTGQKSYRKQSAGYGRTDYAQVINDQLTGAYRFRTVLDGYSADRMITPEGSDPGTECAYDPGRILQAMSSEMAPMMSWLLDGTGLYSLGNDPCYDPLAVPPPDAAPAGGLSTRLEQIHPNPIASGASVRFSLAHNAPVQVSLFDATGRRVRVLVDGPLSAGMHSALWDGSDDSGHRVAAGVYWVRMSTEGYHSSMKMVVVR